MSQIERFDAFISYRHCEPDSEIAGMLHKKLESYRLPRDVAKKVGRNRLTKVFRDDAELAVSDDLSEEINRALRNSDYLICICSPEYLQSAWCRREIETFLQISDRRHVLLVLANGEPDNAFPQVLLYENVYRTNPDGSRTLVRLKSEPLAADCRGDNAKERKEHVDKAVVRLIAAILGIRYDDLQQRHRKAEKIRWMTRAGIAFGVMLAIIGICVFFLISLAQKNAIITQRYNDSLAQTSTNLLTDGRRMDAVYAARLALPDKQTGDFSEQATQALVNALGLYEAPGFSCDDDIMLPCSASIYYRVSPSGRYIAMNGLDMVLYVFDAETGEIVYENPVDTYKIVEFDGDRGIVYKGADNYYRYVDLDSLRVDVLDYTDARVKADPNGNGYALIDSEGVRFFKGPSVVSGLSFANITYIPGESNDAEVCYSVYGEEAFVFYTGYETYMTLGFRVDLTSGEVSEISLGCSNVAWSITTDGRTIAWICQEDSSWDVYLQDINSPDTVRKSDQSFPVLYSVAVLGEDVVAYSNYDIYLFDLQLNCTEFGSATELADNLITKDAIVIHEMVEGIHLIKNGDHIYLNPDNGSSSAAASSRYVNDTAYFVRPGDNCITQYTYRTPSNMELFSGRYEEIEEQDFNGPEARDLIDDVMKTDPGFEEDRISYAFLCENADLGLIQLWDGAMFIYDLKTMECVRTIRSMEGSADGFYYDETEDLYYINTTVGTEVFDKDLKNLYRIQDSHIFGFDEDTGKPVAYSYITWGMYLVDVVSYDEIIALADETLDGYEPDERIREKYSLD